MSAAELPDSPELDASRPPPAQWMVIVGTAAGVFLGVILIVGLYAKALDPEAFVETLQREGLDFLLPGSWVAAVALFLEAMLGFALVLGLRRLRILLPSAGLVAFFVFLTARAYIQHQPGAALDEQSCGCFGNLVERSPAEAFWQDLLMLVPACALAFLARPHAGAPHTRARFITAGALTAAVLVFALLAPGLPLDDLATRLKPGVNVADLCAGEAKPGAEPEDEEEDDGSLPPPEGRVCLLDLIPELQEGESVVVIADIEDKGLEGKVKEFGDYALDAVDAPLLFVIAPAREEELEAYRTMQQPAFDLLMGYPAVLRPLYRRLPRSFLVRDGTVTRTWQGWPPLAKLAAAAKPPGDDGSDEDAPDDGPKDAAPHDAPGDDDRDDDPDEPKDDKR